MFVFVFLCRSSHEEAVLIVYTLIYRWSSTVIRIQFKFQCLYRVDGDILSASLGTEILCGRNFLVTELSYRHIAVEKIRYFRERHKLVLIKEEKNRSKVNSDSTLLTIFYLKNVSQCSGTAFEILINYFQGLGIP